MDKKILYDFLLLTSFTSFHGTLFPCTLKSSITDIFYLFNSKLSPTSGPLLSYSSGFVPDLHHFSTLSSQLRYLFLRGLPHHLIWCCHLLSLVLFIPSLFLITTWNYLMCLFICLHYNVNSMRTKLICLTNVAMLDK